VNGLESLPDKILDGQPEGKSLSLEIIVAIDRMIGASLCNQHLIVGGKPCNVVAKRSKR